MIQKIHLQNFRNFSSKTFEFDKKVTVIIGPNAAGKTNLLESIFLLSTGKSFKANLEDEMINQDEKFARVKALVNDLKLEVLLTREIYKRKKILLNGISKRLIDFAGQFKVVLFGPWDMDLVTASPSLRRKFLDTVISQVDREYRRSVLSYEKGLRQRNRILWDIRENPSTGSHERLLFWDQLLIKNGDYISQKRQEFINFINSLDNKSLVNSYQLIYDKSAISESRLEDYAREEIAAATTLVGPHRDDFIFQIGKRNLSHYGSRGEQRMGVLWIKLAELAFIKEKTKENPTLLLDDIFSELDHPHRKIVSKVVKNQQTIITAADPHFIIDMKDAKRIEF